MKHKEDAIKTQKDYSETKGTLGNMTAEIKKNLTDGLKCEVEKISQKDKETENRREKMRKSEK